MYREPLCVRAPTCRLGAAKECQKKKLLKRLHALRAYTREFTLLRVKKLAVKQKPVRYGESSMAMRFFSCTVITSASPVACCMACERGRVSSFASLNWGDSLTVQQWISGCCHVRPVNAPPGILLTRSYDVDSIGLISRR